VDHAQERSDRELASELKPRVELFPGPAVHSEIAPLAAFPAPDEHGAAASVQVALLKGERFADAQPGAPQQDDQRAESMAIGPVPDRAHDGHNFLDRGRTGWVLFALVARRRPR
jgi:hypothetical protein